MVSRSDRRIAHLADLHFDVEHLGDALASFRFAGQAAIDRGCSALVLAGDIWDRGISVSEKSPLNPVADEICAVAEYMPVVILKGNHDPAGSLDILARLKTHYPVTVASTPRVECINGIHFSLMPYPYKSWLLAQSTGSQDETDLVASDALRAIVRGFAATYATAGIDRPHVLVYHGNVSGCQVESGQTMLGGDVMISAGDLEESGADYIALGHIHMRQRLGTRCYYAGSLYHCNFGEHDQKAMNIATIWPGGHELEEVELPSRRKVVVDLSIGDDGAVYGAQDPALFAGADLKIRYRISEEQAKVTRDEDLERYGAGAHSIRFERLITPRERVRCEVIADVQRLADKVDAWGGSVGQVIEPGVRVKAEQLECEVHHG